MRIALLGIVVVTVLAVAAPASAGCWATVGLAPPPASVGPGDTWTAELTVLQHGRNPLPDAADARPTVIIQNAETGERRTFKAKSTDPKAGTYAAQVVFPSGGSWTYAVNDGFDTWNGEPAPCSQTHSFATVDIGSGGASKSTAPPSGPTAASSSDSSSFPAWPVGGGIAGALLAALALGLVLRRRGPRTQPS